MGAFESELQRLAEKAVRKSLKRQSALLSEFEVQELVTCELEYLARKVFEHVSPSVEKE